jgi:peptidyl-prolyl cis-trans isomerase C
MVTIRIDHAAARRAGAPKPAAKARPERPALPVIRVNDVTIGRKAIAAEMQNYPAAEPRQSLEAAATALVVRALLIQEARRLGLAATPETDAEGKRETEEEALIRALIDAEVRLPEADEAALRRYYDHNRQRFQSPALYEADHILIAARRDDAAAFAAARDTALGLRTVLVAAPEKFAELARAHSACPSATLGGVLGQIAPGETTPEFEAALSGLAPGSVSEPVETRYGVHLIRLHRRVDGAALPFEAVRERIEAYLVESVRRRAVAQYIGLLAGRARIEGFALPATASPLVQ